MTSMRDSLRRAGFGRFLYLLWHKPRAMWARSRREGGPWQQRIDARARAGMIAAAARLPARPPAPIGAPEVAFLTGRRFWFQTAFCCWSLCQQTHDAITPVFIDDGTIDDTVRGVASRLFPGCVVLAQAEIERRLDQHLPAERFPALRQQRRTYVHLRKLTDLHAGRTGWHVVLDSDMLFFRPPTLFAQWLQHPDRPIHLRDVNDAYGYAVTDLQALIAPPLPQALNVGVTGLRSDAIDWDMLEAWCAHLLRSRGTSYYLEQALIALLLAGRETLCLPASDYIVMPTLAECQRPTAVLHHYVDLSKRGYFRHGWKHVSPHLSDRA